MTRVLVSVALLGLVAGCSSQSVTVQRIEPGSECPAGGVRLFIDGKNPEVVCNGTDGTNGTAGTGGQPGGNGTNGVASLVAQSQLAPGDTRCPRGGAEVRSGLDSGGDGGVANDGTLQAGEVTASTVLCNGDDGVRLGSLIPPGGAVGTATIKANGADATAGRGGNGGLVRAAIESGTNGGHVKVWKTGRADATFMIPTPPGTDLGDVPLDITTDTTIVAMTDGTLVDAGVAFMDPSNQAFFVSQGGTAAPKRVSSLHVAAGVTLTVPLMNGGTNLDRSCHLEGTLRAQPSGPQDSNRRIAFHCGDVVLSSTSRVVATGTVQTPNIDVEFDANAGNLLALGTIDTSGLASAPNQPATSAGSISLSGDTLFASGVLRANGGSGSGVPGVTTYGGRIELTGFNGVFNQATIDSNGGDILAPAEGIAGNGGSVLLQVTDSKGELRNRGAISSKGGRSNATTCANACAGGQGSSITLQTIHGGVSNDATLTSTGGAGTTAGGRGGTITLGIAVYSGTTGVFGSVLVSGSLDVSGGAGAVAGEGGTVIVQVQQGADHGAEAILLGYASIEANGGAGLGQGGSGGTGGDIELYQRPGNFSGTRTSAGAVMNTVELRARGGAGDALPGGRGGTVSLYTQTNFEWPAATWEVLDTSGPISVNGGLGSTGGNGGFVTIEGRIAVTSSGSIEAKGGAGTTDAGGTGGTVDVTSRAGRVTASASIDVSAGAVGGGTIQNVGAGGNITLRGVPVVNSGTLTAKGGAADIATGTGGVGGFVQLTSVGGPTQNTVAAPAGIVVSGGVAQTPGAAGAVSIDGFLVTSQWTR